MANKLHIIYTITNNIQNNESLTATLSNPMNG